ncbi:MAG: hypothetical protein IT244_10980 [Bacteroidia bacterium]|nr:hypothetical protein [Bacteroidia bacterium]
MNINWEHLQKSYTSEITTDLKKRIDEIRKNNSHLIEEQQLLAVIEHIYQNRPFFENSIDKEKWEDINSADSLENDFVNEITSHYLECKSKISEDAFFEYFFNTKVPLFLETFKVENSLSYKKGGLQFIDKYVGNNLSFLFRCILQNIIISNAVWGQFKENYYAGFKINNTEPIRKFLGLPSKQPVESGEHISKMTPDSDELKKSMSHTAIVCLIQLMTEQGLFSAQAGPSELKKALDILVGEKVSISTIKEFNRDTNLQNYLSGIKNKSEKEQLAEKLRLIADLLV